MLEKKIRPFLSNNECFINVCQYKLIRSTEKEKYFLSLVTRHSHETMIGSRNKYVASIKFALFWRILTMK